jgi:hypothetical protein
MQGMNQRRPNTSRWSRCSAQQLFAPTSCSALQWFALTYLHVIKNALLVASVVRER